jgi:hypothetical protein
VFFFEKKNQKTFARLSPSSPRQPRKSFCFFFQKEALPCLVMEKWLGRVSYLHDTAKIVCAAFRIFTDADSFPVDKSMRRDW